MKFQCPECGNESVLPEAAARFQFYCNNCGEPLRVVDGIVFRSHGPRNVEFDFKRMLRIKLKTDPDDAIIEEIVLAAAHVLHLGYTDFPELVKWAEAQGYICPWDGKLHRNPECDARAKRFMEENPET